MKIQEKLNKKIKIDIKSIDNQKTKSKTYTCTLRSKTSSAFSDLSGPRDAWKCLLSNWPEDTAFLNANRCRWWLWCEPATSGWDSDRPISKWPLRWVDWWQWHNIPVTRHKSPILPLWFPDSRRIQQKMSGIEISNCVCVCVRQLLIVNMPRFSSYRHWQCHTVHWNVRNYLHALSCDEICVESYRHLCCRGRVSAKPSVVYKSKQTQIHQKMHKK